MALARLISLAVVALLLLTAETGLSPAQRKLNLDSFDHVWKTVRETHWDEKFDVTDWTAVRETLRPAMEKAESMAEARAILTGMLSRLKQSHFGILPADVYSAIDPSAGPGRGDGQTGMDVRVVNGQVLVTRVEDDSPAARAGIRMGWQVLRVNGQDPAPIIQKVNEVYKNSTTRELLLTRAIQSRLNGPVGDRGRFAFLDGRGQTVEVEVEFDTPRGTKASFGHMPPQSVWIVSRRVDGNIGYIAFNMFLDPARLMPAFSAAVASFSSVDGVVIDLRGNPGGIGIMAMGMAGFFIDRPDQRLGTMLMRKTPVRFVVNPRQPGFRGPLAVLLDGGSASTSEIFAGGLKDLGRARIFGTRSAGAALPSVIEKLPNGDGFQYAIANYISEGGQPLEGVGVTPDVEAPHTRELLLQGRDAALESAVHWIRTQQKEKK